MPKHAALYVRQSHTEDGSSSMPIQLETCRATAARFELTVVHELCERPSTSGYRNRGRDRPQFLRLLELVHAGEVDCVVTYKSDRLSRGGGPGWAPLIDAIDTAGLDVSKFVLTADGWLSELEIGIRAAMDREESAKTSARMLAVRAKEAREGKPRIPCAAYGYRYSTATKEVTVVVSEAETIRECTRRVLDGETVYSVVADLNRRGIPTTTGGPWRTKTLLAVLRAPRIAGLRSHLGEIVAEGQWEPIISQDEHHRLVAVTANRHLHGTKRAPRTFPLVGFLTCGRCGQPLRSMTSSQRERKRRRYGCRGGEVGGCGGIQIRAEFIEDAVRDYVIGVIADPDLRERLLAAAPRPDERTHETAMAHLGRIDTARQRLTDLAVDGTITPTEVRRKTTELNQQADQIHAQLAELPLATLAHDLPTTPTELREAWDNGGINYQRTLTGLLIQQITVNPATRMAPGRFDTARLEWSLRA